MLDAAPHELFTSITLLSGLSPNMFALSPGLRCLRVGDGLIFLSARRSPLGWKGDNIFALARYNSDGSLDPMFGSNAKVTTDLFHGRDFLNAIAIDWDGKTVAACYASHPGRRPQFALARYN